jgi:translation initiation factor 4A
MSLEGVQALFIVANRGSATELQKTIIGLGDYMGIECHACVGGTNIREDMAKLKAEAIHIVVGTPGRVLDMINRGALNTESLTIFCMDEADEMLSRGFEDQLCDGECSKTASCPPLADRPPSVVPLLPQSIQVVVLTTTMSPELSSIIHQKLMREPVRLLVKSDAKNPKGVKQFYMNVESEERKFEALCDLDRFINIPRAVIFCNTRLKVEWLAEKMRDIGVSVTSVVRGTYLYRFRS